MFDAEYNDQVRSFVESVEPDFNYQGTDGLISMVIESAENVMTINAYIEAEDEKENFLVRGAKTVGGWVKTAFKAIYEFIKKIIAKIKAIFLSFFHKLKSMYASALEKIGHYLSSKINDGDEQYENKATVTWYKLQPDGFNALYGWLLKDKEKELEEIGNGQFKNVQEGKEREKAPSLDELKSNDKVFKKIESGRISKSDFTSIFNGDITKNLNKAYAAQQKINAIALKAASKAEEKAINAAKTEEGRQKAKEAAQATNKAVHEYNAACVTFMNKMFSVAIFAFHQALKATLFGLKGTAGIKIRQGRNYVAGKVAGAGLYASKKIAAGESYDYETDELKII